MDKFDKEALKSKLELTSIYSEERLLYEIFVLLEEILNEMREDK